MEHTLVLIKPDAFEKGLVGRILSLYEDNGLKIQNCYVTIPTTEILERHYAEHVGRSFYPSLVDFMASGKVLAIHLSGEKAIERVRQINGRTNPAKADAGTIRFLYGTDVQRNAVHGSADPADAARELAIWFPDK